MNNPAQILIDLGTVSSKDCNLKNVSWVIPNFDRSDHPGFQGNQTSSTVTEGGPAWVADIINAVGNSPCQNPDKSSYWNSTAILVVWDDWGGFWDHIGPYEVLNNSVHPCDPVSVFGCGYISGFRVPFLVVSAYTPAGYVSGACGASPLTGAETVLYSFTGGTDGGYPFAGVIQDTTGNLHGRWFCRRSGAICSCCGRCRVRHRRTRCQQSVDAAKKTKWKMKAAQ